MKTGLINTSRVPMRLRATGYQLRKQLPNGKRIEVSLGTRDRALAEERAKSILGEMDRTNWADAWGERVKLGCAPTTGWAWRLWNNACRRKTKYDGLTLGQLEAISLRSGGFCEVSGLQFELDAGSLHPLQPSLDRTDPARGYSADNCRLVALAVNFAMNRWGEEVFLRISAAMLQRHLDSIARGSYAGKIFARETEKTPGNDS